MTIEHKIVVGLDDIMAVTFECNQCHSKLTVPPDKIKLPQDCRQCGAEWFSGVDMPYPTGGSPYSSFIRALTTIRSQLKDRMPFRILLEFDQKEFDEKDEG